MLGKDDVVKALIGRNLLTMDTYFKIMTEVDDGFQKAVKILQEEDAFAQNGIK